MDLITTPLITRSLSTNDFGIYSLIITTAQSTFKFFKLGNSNDTGPMHLAYALGTPLNKIFSSRDYAGKWYRSRNEKDILFRNNEMYCANCFNDLMSGNKCLKEITTKPVIENIKYLSKNF